MIRRFLSLAFVAALVWCAGVPAHGQPVNLQANSVYGRLGIPGTGGPGQSIPFATLGALLGGGSGGSGSLGSCTLVASIPSANLVVALKDASGNDPSPVSSCNIAFGDATAANGDYTTVAVTAPTSFTANLGSSFGAGNNAAFRLWAVLINDGGTVRIGLENVVASASTTGPLRDHILVSSIACNACVNATGPAVIYSNVAVASKAMRIFGYLEWASGLPTAGTYTSGPTAIRLMTLGMSRPGELIYQKCVVNSTITASITATTWTNTNLSVTITPTSTANPVAVWFDGPVQQVNQAHVAETAILKGGTPVGTIQGAYSATGGAIINNSHDFDIDFPQTIGPVSYTVGVQNDAAGGSIFFPAFGSTNSKICAAEFMG